MITYYVGRSLVLQRYHN